MKKSELIAAVMMIKSDSIDCKTIQEWIEQFDFLEQNVAGVIENSKGEQ